MRAISAGAVEVTDILLEHGANMDVCNEDGKTLEEIALGNGFSGMVDALRAERARRALLEDHSSNEYMDVNA